MARRDSQAGSTGGGGRFRQTGRKLHENYKIVVFGSKHWGNMGGQANFWGSGGIPQFPLLGETLASLFHIKKKKFYQKILQKLWPEN